MHCQPKIGCGKVNERTQRKKLHENRCKTEKSERKALAADRSCSRFDKTNGDNDYRMHFLGAVPPI